MKKQQLFRVGGVLIVIFRNSIANFRLFSPTDQVDMSDRSDQSEKPIGQTANPHAISFVKAAISRNILVSFRAFRG